MSNGQVFKVHANRNYTVMSNYHLKDHRLSLKAKGILSIMLSLPDTWDFSKAGLVAIVKEGRTVVENALDELKAAGYIVIEERRDRGRFAYSYNIYEKPRTENPYTDNPRTDNQRQLNTNKLNTKKSNTNNKESKKEATVASYDAIIEEKVEDEEVRASLYEFIKMRKLMKKPLTNKALELLIKKLNNMATSPAEKVELLNQSIMNNWLTIYPLKDSGQKSRSPKEETDEERSKREYVDFLRKREEDARAYQRKLEEEQRQ